MFFSVRRQTAPFVQSMVTFPVDSVNAMTTGKINSCTKIQQMKQNYTQLVMAFRPQVKVTV